MTTPAVPPSPSGRGQRIGLEAVALEAGVSVATASRALSGRAVRAPLKLRVEAAARRLGYRPDLAAQAVARGATKAVALIVDYLRSPFGVEITRGVVDAAARHGLVVNVTGAETHPGDLLEMIASARALRPRSIVLATGRVQDPEIRDELIRVLDSYQASGGSVAIVDGLDLPFSSCAFDEITAAHALCRALVELGYTRPIVFNSSSERSDLASRTRALIEGFQVAGVPRSAIELAELSTAASRDTPDEELLSLGDADVVVCVEGAVIPAVYRHIRGRGLLVGIDVAVTAFGQYAIADALRPHLTTVELPLRRAGDLALEHALADDSGTHLSLPGNLRVRASTPRRLRTRHAPGLRESRPRWLDRGAVGIIIPPPGDADISDVVREIFALAHRNRRPCAILTEESLLAGGLSGHYDSLIVCGPLSESLAEHVREHGMSCVVVDAPTDARVAQLSVESWEGMQTLLEHLYALGHTRIAYMAGRRDDSSEEQRRWGIELFTATHAAARIIFHAAPLDDDALLSRLLTDGTTAVVAHSHHTAVEVMRLLTSSGLDVPGDVSIAGFSGAWESELSTLEVTTVTLEATAAASAAWRLVDTPVDAEVRSLGVRLIPRRSTDIVRAS